MTNIWIYAAACLAIIAIPGPAVIFILSRTVIGGYRAGFQSAAGIAVGAMVNALASAIGLAVLFEAIPASLTVVRYLGAAYLLYLAYKTLTQKSAVKDDHGSIPTEKYFSQSVVVSLLNPKVTLFFAAFLPGFIDPNQGQFAQILVLASIFVLIALIYDTLIVLTSGFTRQFFSKNARGDNTYFQYASAACLTIVAGFAVS